MRFAPGSVQILLISLLAAFLLTSCGDQGSRQPAPQEESPEDAAPSGEDPTPQVPVV